MAAVQSLLKPVFALVGWTFAMEGWMYATRLPAMTKYNVKTDPNFSKEKLNNQIPPHIRWKGEHFCPPTHTKQVANHNAQPTTTIISTKHLHVFMQWLWGLRCMPALRLLR